MLKSDKVDISREAKKFMAEVQSLNKKFIKDGLNHMTVDNNGLKMDASVKNKKMKKRI